VGGYVSFATNIAIAGSGMTKPHRKTRKFDVDETRIPASLPPRSAHGMIPRSYFCCYFNRRYRRVRCLPSRRFGIPRRNPCGGDVSGDKNVPASRI